MRFKLNLVTLRLCVRTLFPHDRWIPSQAFRAVEGMLTTRRSESVGDVRFLNCAMRCISPAEAAPLAVDPDTVGEQGGRCLKAV